MIRSGLLELVERYGLSQAGATENRYTSESYFHDWLGIN